MRHKAEADLCLVEISSASRTGLNIERMTVMEKNGRLERYLARTLQILPCGA